MRVDWCVSSWIRIKNTQLLTHTHTHCVQSSQSLRSPFLLLASRASFAASSLAALHALQFCSANLEFFFEKRICHATARRSALASVKYDAPTSGASRTAWCSISTALGGGRKDARCK